MLIGIISISLQFSKEVTNHYPEILAIIFSTPMLTSHFLYLLFYFNQDFKSNISKENKFPYFVNACNENALGFPHSVCLLYISNSFFSNWGNLSLCLNLFFFLKDHSGQCREQLRRKQEYTRELQSKIPYEHKGKNPQENTKQAKSSSIFKGLCTITKWDLLQKGKVSSAYKNLSNTPEEQNKEKSSLYHVIISNDAEKAIKTQHALMS